MWQLMAFRNPCQFCSVPCTTMRMRSQDKLIQFPSGRFLPCLPHIHHMRTISYSSCKKFRTKANRPQITTSSTGTSSEDGPPPGCSRIKVQLKKPLGLILEEDAAGNIFVAEVAPGGNAEKSGQVETGDQLIATSAVVYGDEEAYQGVKVRKGMQVVRLNVRGEKFKTVIAAIGTHPGYMPVTLELQKCKERGDNGGLRSG